MTCRLSTLRRRFALVLALVFVFAVVVPSPAVASDPENPWLLALVAAAGAAIGYFIFDLFSSSSNAEIRYEAIITFITSCQFIEPLIDCSQAAVEFSNWLIATYPDVPLPN